MSESFRVGEIVIVCKAEYAPENLGIEVEIVRAYGLVHTRETPSGFMGYVIRRSDGVRFGARPEHLRKRRPPQDWVRLCRLTDLPREVTCV